MYHLSIELYLFLIGLGLYKPEEVSTEYRRPRKHCACKDKIYLFIP